MKNHSSITPRWQNDSMACEIWAENTSGISASPLLVVSVIFCFCLKTLIPKWYASCWRHYHMTLSTRGKTACVWPSVWTHACIHVWFTTVWAHCQWAQSVCPAYQRCLWNVLSWRGASARCDPSRTVGSCPTRVSSSGKPGRQTRRLIKRRRKKEPQRSIRFLGLLRKWSSNLFRFVLTYSCA